MNAPRGWRGPAVAVLAGLLLAAAFPPVGAGLLAVPAVALLTWSQFRVSVRRGLGLGLIAGLSFFVPLLWWMRVVGLDATLGLAAFCAAWLMLQGAATALVTRLPWWPAWAAAAWVLQESLRGSVPYGGFPWGRLAFAQADTPFGALAPLTGLGGVTFTVALAGMALLVAARALRERRWRAAAASALALAALVAVPAVLPLAAPAQGSATVAIVQGGTPQVGMGAMDVRRAVLENHVRETMALARRIGSGSVPRPDFVLWPENSSDIDPFADPEAGSLISVAARAVGVPILVGAIVEVPGNPDGVWNLGVAWDPVAGPGERYAKRHPVPFGEYIPMRSLIAPLIERFDRIPRDFVPGDQAGLFRIGDVLVGDLICFEVAYDDVVQPLLDAEVQLLTVQTNNATYAGTSQPAQQLEITRMRALESGRTVAVAATTGISAFIGPDGALVQHLAEGETGALIEEVPLATGRTPAALAGPVVTALLSVAGAAAIVAAVIWSRRRAGAAPTPATKVGA